MDLRKGKGGEGGKYRAPPPAIPAYAPECASGNYTIFLVRDLIPECMYVCMRIYAYI